MQFASLIIAIYVFLQRRVCPSVRYMQNEVRAKRVNRPYAQAIVYLALVKACNYSECVLCKTRGVCDDALINRLRNRLLAQAKMGITTLQFSSNDNIKIVICLLLFQEGMDRDIGRLIFYLEMPIGIDTNRRRFL